MKLGGQTVVSNIETGERRLDVVEFLELAKALDVPAATLLNRLVAYLADSRP
jgi:transcriptional regulator with XRE-family HTH domain